jgi:hypothetical protein
MKTSYYSAPLTAALIAITATFVAQAIRANTILMTEHSSTSLTVVENGSTLSSSDVNNTSADHWTVTLPTAVLSLTFAIVWAEPENLALDRNAPTGWNAVTWDSTTQLSIVSDTSFSNALREVSNGTDTFISSTDRESDQYRFTDVSDSAVATPDTGSTFGLLSLALAALFGASRLRLA